MTVDIPDEPPDRPPVMNWVALIDSVAPLDVNVWNWVGLVKVNGEGVEAENNCRMLPFWETLITSIHIHAEEIAGPLS